MLPQNSRDHDVDVKHKTLHVSLQDSPICHGIKHREEFAPRKAQNQI